MGYQHASQFMRAPFGSEASPAFDTFDASRLTSGKAAGAQEPHSQVRQGVVMSPASQPTPTTSPRRSRWLNAAAVAAAGFVALVLAGWTVGKAATVALDRGHGWWFENSLIGVGGRDLHRFMHMGTLLGTLPFGAGVIAAGMLVALLTARRRVMLLPIAFVGGLLIVEVVKVLVHRPCPPAGLPCGPNAAGGSFPSGHAFDATIVFGSLAMVFAWGASRPVRLVTYLAVSGVAVLVGVSRAYFGIHWVSDVIAGWLLGAAWLVVVGWAYTVWNGAPVWKSPHGGTLGARAGSRLSASAPARH